MATPEIHVSVRKPLQPKNTAAADVNFVVVMKEGSKTKQVKSKPKQEHRLNNDSNKENLNHHHHPVTVYATPTKKKKVEASLDLDSSLAEELSAMRKRLERLRLDKEKTEKMLKEREAVLDSQLKEMEDRGLFQKQLEIEVDRLFRLKELKSYCMRISPIKSLRERQQGGRKNNVVQSVDIKAAAEWEEESMDENTLQSPTPSDSSEFVGENNND
ncbi:Stonustoxin subunit beta [Gossypium arboreum]|uniref:Stonustoxin subunit beta n=1 Tax=Gossypium arboreum TaxID=29729 RepID=A0A0B0MC00_GOSAR|nr:Stonustoxin subunit beta [Gossypium arboreum]